MSRRSLIVILIALALLLVAAAIRTGWLYLVSSVLLSLVLVSLVSGWRSTRRIEVGRRCPAEVFEGEKFRVKLTVSNSGRLARYLVRIVDRQFEYPRVPPGIAGRLYRWRNRPSGREYRESLKRRGLSPGARSVAIETLLPGDSVDLAYDATARLRGVYGQADMTVSSGGVLGLADVRRSLRLESPVMVFPKVYHLDSFVLSPLTSTPFPGTFEWSRKGAGQDYYGVREYQHGDPLRHIHWMSSARRNDLIVKEYQQELRPLAGLLLLLTKPVYGSHDSNSMEDGLRAAASIVWYFSRTGAVPRMLLPEGGGFTLEKPRSTSECLALLSSYLPPDRNGSPIPELRPGLIQAGHGLEPGCALVVITNLEPNEVTRELRKAVGPARITVVLVLEDSYRRGGGEREEKNPGGLAGISIRPTLDVFVVTGGREIDECLGKPLSTTAG